MAGKPFWYPQPTDEAWVARIRADYPEETRDLSDGEVREEYAEGWKYETLWDHLGDARADYESLADAFLALRAQVAADHAPVRQIDISVHDMACYICGEIQPCAVRVRFGIGEGE